MDHSWKTELMVGAFMAAGLLALFFLAMQVSNLSLARVGDDGYRVFARFDNIGSLKVRAPVNLAGVRVGRVEAIALDPDTFHAVLTLRIDRRYDRLPRDTFASIFTAGLLGEQYVSLEPGGSDETLGEGDRIEHTQSALVLERLVGQLLFSKAGEKSP